MTGTMHLLLLGTVRQTWLTDATSYGFYYSSEFVSAFGVGNFYQEDGIVKFDPWSPVTKSI